MPISDLWSIKDSGEGSVTGQSILMQTYLDCLPLASSGEGVISGAVVTAQGSPDMTLAVSSGSVKISGAVVTVASGNVTVTAADGANPRIDIVQVNSAGTKSVVAGTAAANPKAPALSGTALALAAVWVGAGVTSITTTKITTLRVIVPDPEYMMTFTIDGNGAAITTGVKGDTEVPYTGVITGWTILGDQSGSIVVDVWKDTYANYPPTGGDTITGAEKPTISAATKGQDLSLNTWVTAVTKGDTLRFNVDSCSTITRVVISIRIARS